MLELDFVTNHYHDFLLIPDGHNETHLNKLFFLHKPDIFLISCYQIPSPKLFYVIVVGLVCDLLQQSPFQSME